MKQWCQLHTLYNSQLENKLLFLTQQEQVLKDDGADSYWVEIGWHCSKGYIDVGDGCWRRNVLVTILAILVTNILYLFTLASGPTHKSLLANIDLYILWNG